MSNFEKDNKKRRHPELLIPAGSLEVPSILVEKPSDSGQKQRIFRWKRWRKEWNLPMNTM